MRFRKIYITLSWIQGTYILITALWGLLHIESFMAVTGPKIDIWLVKTVSVVLIPIALCLFFGVREKIPSLPVMLVGLTTAFGLACIDFYYTATEVIKWIYAVDGVIECMFTLCWTYLLIRTTKEFSSTKQRYR